MDPFSVVVGVGSLIDLSLRLGKFLKDVHASIALYEGEIESFLGEVQDLESVNKSIAELYQTETVAIAHGHSEPQQLEVWQNTLKTLRSCTISVEALQTLLNEITGKTGAKVAGLRDGIKKQLKKQSKDSELIRIRQQLSSHRESLSVSLTLLNL